MNLFKTSPETSKLFQKVDIPVNYSTGGINYSLPIYTIKLKILKSLFSSTTEVQDFRSMKMLHL